MGFLDWLLGKGGEVCDGDPRLAEAVARVIDATDPRLRLLDGVRERLCPAVTGALAYADRVAAALPPCVEVTPDNWSASPVLRAFFVRPADVAATLHDSRDLQDFLASPAGSALDRVCCVIAATRSEQTVLGTALEGDILRQDVEQKTVSFGHFRLFGFAATEEALRRRIADTVLEGLVLAALRAINTRQQEGDRLAFAQRLLSGRLALMEKSRAGLDALECGTWKGRDIGRLRDSLAANAAELAAHHSAGGGLEGALEGIIRTLEAADAVIHAERLSLSLDAMNVAVPPDSPGAATVELLEFSTATPGTSRRVAFLASVPRHAVAERKLDLAAGLRLL
ncbi:hypothetical protein [Zoogloea sp.]|uniref:hypothetical protein n=1 Tax=Zoogloea sp. TaxID=49181 RepID=UPI0035B3BF9C